MNISVTVWAEPPTYKVKPFYFLPLHELTQYWITLPKLAILYVGKMSSLLSFTLLIIGLVFLSTSEALVLRRHFGGGRFGFGYWLKFGGERGQGGGEQEVEEGIGNPCKPAVPYPCGRKTLLSGPEVEELDEEEFGPNVCRYTFTFEVNTFSFELRRFRCGQRAGECPLVCSCTGSCSKETITQESKVIDCCEGYTAPRPTPLEIVKGGHKSGINSSGCPISTICPEEGTTAAPTTTETSVIIPPVIVIE